MEDGPEARTGGGEAVQGQDLGREHCGGYGREWVVFESEEVDGRSLERDGRQRGHVESFLDAKQ